MTTLIVCGVVLLIIGLITYLFCISYNNLFLLKRELNTNWQNLIVQINYRFQLSASYISAIQQYVNPNTLNELINLVNTYNMLVSATDIINSYYNINNSLTKINAELAPQNLNLNEWVNAYSQNQTNIENLRMTYDSNVIKINKLIDSFPASVVAKLANFSKWQTFEIRK